MLLLTVVVPVPVIFLSSVPVRFKFAPSLTLIFRFNWLVLAVKLPEETSTLLSIVLLAIMLAAVCVVPEPLMFWLRLPLELKVMLPSLSTSLIIPFTLTVTAPCSPMFKSARIIPWLPIVSEPLSTLT